MSEPILELDNVSKAFGGLKVIDGVSFSVLPGSRTALIGPNGAGKTTVFNLISGIYPIDGGDIRLEGRSLVALPSRKRIRAGLSRSFQNIRLMPHLSVVENVMLGSHSKALRLRDLLAPVGWSPRSRWRLEAQERLAAAGIDIAPGEVVSALPYGIRKKIEVVRALMSRPKVLMLDEPAAGLNPQETSELATFLRGVADEGVTLLLVEHDMSFVHALAERVVVLNFGAKIFEGPVAEARRDKAVLEAYLGTRVRAGGTPGGEGANAA